MEVLEKAITAPNCHFACDHSSKKCEKVLVPMD